MTEQTSHAENRVSGQEVHEETTFRRRAAAAGGHITSRRDVWLATGGEIADWYNRNYLKDQATTR
ncbi:hypothetical protein [Sinorhizobium psoraleae]|uniref:hypothetical protein n=1 Tax=Sinorhizobium psoraleae TaxID=520838 RepID=UPI001568EDE1|nr:hypothetical protein [Sinorhizobium psoraleae]